VRCCWRHSSTYATTSENSSGSMRGASRRPRQKWEPNTWRAATSLAARAQTFTAILDVLTVRVTEMFRDPPFITRYASGAAGFAHLSAGSRLARGLRSAKRCTPTAILLSEAGFTSARRSTATDMSSVAVEQAREGVSEGHAQRFRAATTGQRRRARLRRLWSRAYATFRYCRLGAQRHVVST